MLKKLHLAVCAFTHTLEWIREVNAGSLQASPYDQIGELQLQWDTLSQKIKWTTLVLSTHTENFTVL